MLIIKIIYLALIIGLVIFSVLYIDSLAVILLICVLVLPVFLLFSLLWARLTCRAELLCTTPVTATSETIPLTVSLVSRCPLPFPCVHVTVGIKHAFGKSPEVMQMHFPLRGRNTTRMTCYIHADCCGTVDVSIRRIRIYDYLRLFSCSVRITERTQHITVLPRRIQVPIENSAPPAYCENSDIYADISGDDPSEVSNFRDYLPGDSVSRIHWKLSSKADRLIIKEFGMPVKKSVLLAVEHIAPEKTASLHVMQQAETLLSLAYSLSCELMEAGIPYEIAWYSAGQEQLQRRTPLNSASLIEIFCTMFLSIGNMPLPVSELTDKERICSSIICLSNHVTSDLPYSLEREVNATQKTVVFVSEQFQEPHAGTDSVSTIHLRSDALAQDLPTLIV